MKNKCTLICDFNWLTISRFSVINKGFDKTLPEYALNEAKEELKDMLTKSINVILNRFPVIDNIVVVADGGSWRKQLPVPEQLKNITYKGNRQADVEMSWDHIWAASSEILENCRKEGITVSQHNNIEGDDWVWYWSRRLNKNGINTIIWSSDCDLKQLVQVDNDTDAFTVWYNDKNGIWIPKEMEEHDIDDIEYFMQPTYENAILETLKMRSKSGVNYIQPDSIILSKIICGDAGDNIKSVVRYTKNGRNYRFAEKDWDGVSNQLNINTIEDLIKNKNKVAKAICNHKKVYPHDISTSEILEMINYNIKLVWLNESVIPETCILAMNNVEYNEYDVDYIRSNYKVICGDRRKDEIMSIFDSI